MKIRGNESSESKSNGDSLKEFFLQEKPADIMIILNHEERSHASELCKIADTTYSHCVKVMNKMKANGLVDSEKRGRKKEYTLTERGQDIADSLLEIYNAIDGLEIPKKDEKTDLENIRMG